MGRHFVFWASVLILNLVANGICLRYLATNGVSPSLSLVSRGLSCMLIVLIFATRHRLSLVPNFPRKQITRALIAGLALTFFTMSYTWLTASAISVLSNIDVPLLVALGPVIGVSASRRHRLLALISILFLFGFVLHLEFRVELIYGLASLTIGMVLLCVGYWFIKKSMSEENKAVTIMVPSLAILFYGLVQSPDLAFDWSPLLLISAFISGASMFGAYYATMRLYEHANLALAEFPTLIASIAIQPFEWIILGHPLQLSYVLYSVGFVFFIAFLLKQQHQDLSHA